MKGTTGSEIEIDIFEGSRKRVICGTKLCICGIALSRHLIRTSYAYTLNNFFIFTIWPESLALSL